MSCDRALVVDDDPSWREILSELLEDLELTVDAASTLAEAREYIQDSSYRIAVVDLSLSPSDHRNDDGLEILHSLQSHDSNCQAILLTGYATVEIAVNVITEGKALTCLQKESFSRQAFLQLLKKHLKPSILETLTDREREVLEQVAQGKTNQQVAAELFISPNTVKGHLKVVFEKLEVNNRAEAAALLSKSLN